MESLSHPQVPPDPTLVGAFWRYHERSVDVYKLDEADRQRQFERDILLKESEIAKLETRFSNERAKSAALELSRHGLLREISSLEARLAQTESGKHLSENLQAQIKNLQEDSESKMIAENFALKKEVGTLMVEVSFLKTSQKDYKKVLEDKLKLEQQLQTSKLQSELAKSSEAFKTNSKEAEKKLRQELSESRALLKKQTALADKLQREVDKLNSKLLTQKSVFEGKIDILQNKLKTAKEVKKIVAAIKPNAKNVMSVVPDSFNSPIRASQPVSAANPSSASGLFSMTPFLSKITPRLPTKSPNDSGPSFASPTASTTMKARKISPPVRSLSPSRRSTNIGLNSSPIRLDQLRGSLASSTPISTNSNSSFEPQKAAHMLSLGLKSPTRSMSLQPLTQSKSLFSTPVKAANMRYRQFSSPAKVTAPNVIATTGTSITKKHITFTDGNVIPQISNPVATSTLSLVKQPRPLSASQSPITAALNPILKPYVEAASNVDPAPITKVTQSISNTSILLPSIPDPPILSPNTATAAVIAADKSRSAVAAKKSFSIFDSPIGGDLFSKASRQDSVSLKFTKDSVKGADLQPAAPSSSLNPPDAVPSSSSISSETNTVVTDLRTKKRKRRVGGKRPVFQDDDEDDAENRDEFDNSNNPGFDFKRIKPGAVGFVKEISPRRTRNDIIRDQFSI